MVVLKRLTFEWMLKPCDWLTQPCWSLLSTEWLCCNIFATLHLKKKKKSESPGQAFWKICDWPENCHWFTVTSWPSFTNVHKTLSITKWLFFLQFFCKIIQFQCDQKKTPPHPRSTTLKLFFPKLLRFHKANLFLKCQTAQLHGGQKLS